MISCEETFWTHCTFSCFAQRNWFQRHLACSLVCNWKCIIMLNCIKIFPFRNSSHTHDDGALQKCLGFVTSRFTFCLFARNPKHFQHRWTSSVRARARFLSTDDNFTQRAVYISAALLKKLMLTFSPFQTAGCRDTVPSKMTRIKPRPISTSLCKPNVSLYTNNAKRSRLKYCIVPLKLRFSCRKQFSKIETIVGITVLVIIAYKTMWIVYDFTTQPKVVCFSCKTGKYKSFLWPSYNVSWHLDLQTHIWKLDKSF